MNSQRLAFGLSACLTKDLIGIQIGRNLPKDFLAMHIYSFACQLNAKRQHAALEELVSETTKIFADMEMRLESNFSLSKEQKVRV